jgi:peptidylprolyl isomerase
MVIVDYETRLSSGKVFDSSQKSGSLKFLVGAGKVLVPVEKAVVGMEPGDSKTVAVPAAQGYGERNEDRVLEIPRDGLPDNLALEAGDRIQFPDKQGRKVLATVSEITAEQVTLDANHPLAGEDLTVGITLVRIG